MINTSVNKKIFKNCNELPYCCHTCTEIKLWLSSKEFGIQILKLVKQINNINNNICVLILVILIIQNTTLAVGIFFSFEFIIKLHKEFLIILTVSLRRLYTKGCYGYEISDNILISNTDTSVSCIILFRMIRYFQIVSHTDIIV